MTGEFLAGIGGGLLRSGSGGGGLDPDGGGEGDRVSRLTSNDTRRLEEGLSSFCDLSVCSVSVFSFRVKDLSVRLVSGLSVVCVLHVSGLSVNICSVCPISRIISSTYRDKLLQQFSDWVILHFIFNSILGLTHTI